MILIYIILLGTLVYAIFYVAQFYNIVFYGYPPFISSSQDSIVKIIKATDIKGEETVYELGCGRARFLKTIEGLYPKTKLIGVENLFSVYLSSKLRLKFQGSHIKLLNEDFFKLNLSDANIIYCYLNNTTMIKLGEKIIKKCKSGTQVISQTFTLPQLTPNKVENINNKKVYFYIV